MPGPLVAGVVGSVASAGLQANAAKKAGAAQGRAADAQIAETRRQFDLVQSLLKPYVSAGNVGLQAQLDLMGLGGSSGAAPSIEEIAAAGSGGGAGGGTGSYGASGGIAGSLGGWNTSSPNSFSNQGGGVGTANGATRFRVNGQEFATRAEAEAYANANKTGGISAQDAQRNAISAIENGSQFGALVKQGEYGLMANQAATGGLRGGDTARAMAEFRPAMLQALIDKQLAQYGGLAANGQNAAAMTGTAAQNAGAQVNAALGDRGAAQAGAALAGGQAWANAGAGILNTIGSMAQPTTPGGGVWQRWTF